MISGLFASTRTQSLQPDSTISLSLRSRHVLKESSEEIFFSSQDPISLATLSTEARTNICRVLSAACAGLLSADTISTQSKMVMITQRFARGVSHEFASLVVLVSRRVKRIMKRMLPPCLLICSHAAAGSDIDVEPSSPGRRQRHLSSLMFEPGMISFEARVGRGSFAPSSKVFAEINP